MSVTATFSALPGSTLVLLPTSVQTQALTLVLTLMLALMPALTLFSAGVAQAGPALFGEVTPVLGANFHDFQNFQNIPYFHGGTDFCVPAGTSVYAPVSGTVKVNSYQIDASRRPRRFRYHRTPFRRNNQTRDRYVEVSIDTWNGQRWMLRHIDSSTIPDELLQAAARSSKIAAGTFLGKVVAWHQNIKPETALYHHLHLEVRDREGRYLNPRRLLAPLPDTTPPQIHDIWFVRGNSNVALLPVPHPHGEAVRLHGAFDIVCAATDRVDNSPYLTVPDRITWAIDTIGSDNARQPHTPEQVAFSFDQLPTTGDRTEFALDVYCEKIEFPRHTIVANGAEGPRFFMLYLTHGNPATGYAGQRSLHTDSFAPGLYYLTVTVEDASGNKTSASRLFVIGDQ